VHRGVITGSEQPALVSGSDSQQRSRAATGHVHWGSMDGGDGVLLPTHLSVLSASDIHRGRHLALARDSHVLCASAGEGKRDRQGELETKERKQPFTKASVLPAKLATNKATSITAHFFISPHFTLNPTLLQERRPESRPCLFFWRNPF
jgi:hypothetical protein